MINLKFKQQDEKFAQASNDDNYGKYTGLAIGTVTAMTASMPTWAAIDTAGITAGVAEAATAVGLIGAAVVLVVLGVKVFKWIARSL